MVVGANGNLKKNVLLHQGAGLSLKAVSYEKHYGRSSDAFISLSHSTKLL